MDRNYKIYHLSIPGINKELFNHPLYLNKCRKINFNGVINEREIITEKGTDYISLAPKFKPHSDYEMMLQSTDSIVKSPITSLTDEAVSHIFTTGQEFIKFLSEKEVIEKYGLNGGYPYLVFNYDEYTTDRHSGMSKKPFHLHLNSWKKDTIGNIERINVDEVSPFYYESVVDPIFDLTQTLAKDALDCDELKDFIEPVKPTCGNQEIYYSSVYRIKKGWEFLSDEQFSFMLKTVHRKLEERYKEILRCFCGTDEIPKLYTRHLLLPRNEIINNIVSSEMQDTTKEVLIKLIDRVRSITPEQFQEISKNTDYRDTIIPMRWLAYSMGFFSNTYIDEKSPICEQNLYMNCTPRLFTKIGGASIMNFPEHSLVKIDRGEGDISKEEFERRAEFHQDFAKKLKLR